MKKQRTLIFVFAIAATALGCALVFAGVSTESPFAPRGFGAAGGGAANNSPIELRGISSDDQGLRFAIYDPAKKEGAWVRVNEKDQPYVVHSYDAATNSISVEYQGRVQTITLAEPKFGPGKTVAIPAAPAPPGDNASNPADRFARWQRRHQLDQNQDQQGQQAQPNPAEEQRIEAIRAEIARRRALRDAANASDSGAQPQPSSQ